MHGRCRQTRPFQDKPIQNIPTILLSCSLHSQSEAGITCMVMGNLEVRNRPFPRVSRLEAFVSELDLFDLLQVDINEQFWTLTHFRRFFMSNDAGATSAKDLSFQTQGHPFPPAFATHGEVAQQASELMDAYWKALPYLPDTYAGSCCCCSCMYCKRPNVWASFLAVEVG